MAQCNHGACPLSERLEKLSDELIILRAVGSETAVLQRQLKIERQANGLLVEDIKRLGRLIDDGGCPGVCAMPKS